MLTPRENVMAVFNRQQPDYYGDFMPALQFVSDPVFLRDRIPQDGQIHQDGWGTCFCFKPGAPGAHPVVNAENAVIKAETACRTLGLPVLADDSGVCVPALGGAPGVHSARYAGEHASDAENLDKLLDAVCGKTDRRARFVSVITAVFPDGRRITARGECEGKILDERRGSGSFGYDPVFYYEPLGKTFAEMLGEQVCELGTFSKIVAPGMRIGWIACKQPELYAKLLAFKSTMDLHTNIFGQMVLAEYLADNDLDEQIEKIKKMYGEKAEKMMDCMAKDFPEGVTYTKPEGGMFIWATMPEGLAAVDVMDYAAKRGVAVCPGDPFYEEDRNVRTMRINYSNSSDENIEKGIKILGDALRELLAK